MNIQDAVAHEITNCAATATTGMDKEGAWIITIASVLMALGFWLFHDVDAGPHKPTSAKIAGGYAVIVVGALVFWALSTLFLG